MLFSAYSFTLQVFAKSPQFNWLLTDSFSSYFGVFLYRWIETTKDGTNCGINVKLCEWCKKQNASALVSLIFLFSGSCRIGGAVPIVFSFFAEVLSREKRGEHLSWLCMFWMIGEIYASAMAWAIIPHYGECTCKNVNIHTITHQFI